MKKIDKLENSYYWELCHRMLKAGVDSSLCEAANAKSKEVGGLLRDWDKEYKKLQEASRNVDELIEQLQATLNNLHVNWKE